VYVFMGLNLSNAQIAEALDSHPNDVQRMTAQRREGIVARQPEPVLAGAVGGLLPSGWGDPPRLSHKKAIDIPHGL